MALFDPYDTSAEESYVRQAEQNVKVAKANRERAKKCGNYARSAKMYHRTTASGVSQSGTEYDDAVWLAEEQLRQRRESLKRTQELVRKRKAKDRAQEKEKRAKEKAQKVKEKEAASKEKAKQKHSSQESKYHYSNSDVSASMSNDQSSYAQDGYKNPWDYVIGMKIPGPKWIQWIIRFLLLGIVLTFLMIRFITIFIRKKVLNK